jgi:hypothetical protein
MNDKDDKFLMNKETGKTYINPKYLNQIKKFTLVKNLVADCVDENSGLVDVSMLKQMIEQLYLKINIFKEKKKNGELVTEQTEDQYVKQTCYELLIARPGTI